MRRTNIYLEEGQAAALDRMAAEEGTSRAAILRRILDRALVSNDENLAADLAAIRDSFGALAGDDDFEMPDRSEKARRAHLERVWHSAK